MKLSDSGESRVNGYLFVLERSLLTFLPRETARDAVREIDSHLRDRIAGAEGVPDEHAALEWWRRRRAPFTLNVRPAL